jgi:hypothetical protein
MMDKSTPVNETPELVELRERGIDVSQDYWDALETEEQRERFLYGMKTQLCLPGEPVRINQKIVAQALSYHGNTPEISEMVGMLQSLQNVGDRVMTVDRIIVDPAGRLFHTVTNSGMKIDDTFITHGNPHIHEYGLLTLHQDRLWFVQLSERDDSVLRVFEITQEPHRVFKNQLDVDSLTGIRQMLENEENQGITGEFSIEDHGAETWGMLFSPWTSGTKGVPLEKARALIEEALANRPLFN